MLYAKYHMPGGKKSAKKRRRRYCTGLHHHELRLPGVSWSRLSIPARTKPYKWFELKS